MSYLLCVCHEQRCEVFAGFLAQIWDSGVFFSSWVVVYEILLSLGWMDTHRSRSICSKLWWIVLEMDRPLLQLYSLSSDVWFLFSRHKTSLYLSDSCCRCFLSLRSSTAVHCHGVSRGTRRRGSVDERWRCRPEDEVGSGAEPGQHQVEQTLR